MYAIEAASGRFYVCKRYKYFSKLTPSFTGTCSSTESINDFSRKEPAVCIISVREISLASPPVMQEAKRDMPKENVKSHLAEDFQSYELRHLQ